MRSLTGYVGGHSSIRLLDTTEVEVHVNGELEDPSRVERVSHKHFGAGHASLLWHSFSILIP